MEYDKYQNKLSLKNKISRVLWNFFWLVLFRPFNLPQFNFLRIFLLRCFGAKIGKGCKIQSTVKIWAPWNLELGDLVAFGFDVLCYNPGKVIIGNKVAISHNVHLCSASHDFTKKNNPLITKPIVINELTWVSTDSFIGMGVTIGKGAIIGARSSVFKDVKEWTIVGGSPAKFIKKRILND